MTYALGADPYSGLWEFWHVQTGAEPQRGKDGVLVMEEDTGLVFVLSLLRTRPAM